MTPGIYIIFLQIQGVLPLGNIVLGNDIGTTQNREIGIIPIIVLGIFQTVFNNLLGSLTAGLNVEIIVIALISRISA